MKKLIRIMLAMLLLTATYVANAQSQTQLEQDLADFRAWMRKKADQGDSITRAEWPNIKREYKQLTANLNSNANKLSEKSKAEYNELTNKYNEWEERSKAEPVRGFERQVLEKWEKDMTGTTRISRIKPINLRDAYVQMMDYTREFRRSWSAKDWEYAEFVYGELNSRKSQVLSSLPNGDKIKIAALQVEFTSLKSSREAKDAYENMRESKR